MKRRNRKTELVVGLFPEEYQAHDLRLNKPVCHQQVESGKITGSMLLQDLEIAPIEGGKEITYFGPNNIALLLSISSKSLVKAKRLYSEFFLSPSIEFRLEKVEEDKKLFLSRVSSTVCDYIEHIQTAVVFAYTALETFANLSVPEGYTYQTQNKSKGITEVYDKEAIERRLSLKVKFQHVLREIYRTQELEHQKWWGHFSNLERYRNDIIHQKTINSTRFYKEYFKKAVFQACESPVSIIRFFYEAHAESNRTNPIWPWLVNEKNYFPITQFYSDNFEVIGNAYEGIKK